MCDRIESMHDDYREKKSAKRKPADVISSKNIRIPIYRTRSRGITGYQIAFYCRGERMRQRAPSLDAARALAKAKVEELTSGTAHVRTFTPKEAAAIENAEEILRSIDVPLSEAVQKFAEAYRILDGHGNLAEAARYFVAEANRRNIPKKKFAEIVAEFLQEIETKELSAQYLRDSRARLQRAALTFKTHIADIQASDIETWLSVGKRSARTYNNDRNALVTLMNFAKRKGYLARNVESAAELIPKKKEVSGEIEILTPSQYETLLAHTPDSFVPYVALAGLAGLRTAEISRLDWSEINLEEGHITLKAAKAKTASRRIVPICDSLKALLLPVSRKEGKVMPYANEQSMMNRWSELKSAMVDKKERPVVEVPTNALRHSYATYRLALVQDAAKVALEMGNSPRKLFEHYRELATPKVAEKWFSAVRKPLPQE